MAGKEVSRRKFVRDSAVAAAAVAAGAAAANAAEVDKSTILNYNENMEYRPCGKTGWMVSAVAMGGHWKRIDKMVPGVSKGGGCLSADLKDAGFQKNRHDVVSRLMDVGVNWIDACTVSEVKAYSAALKGRRDKMRVGCSWYEREMRNGGCRTKDKLLATLDWGLKDSGIEYCDLWRITMHERSSRHTKEEVEEMMKALEAAKKSGKVRFTGFSSHDRQHIKWMIETYPEVVDIVVTPYTARTKEKPKDSLFDTLRKCKVGFFGIKPFASNSIFKGDSTLDSPSAEEDDKAARLTLRYILQNDAITAPIPGLINTHQVDNIAKAVKERRELDSAEAKQLDKIMDEAWAKLPDDYQWLKDWDCV